MRSFRTLLVREFREWRTVFFVIISAYLLTLILITFVNSKVDGVNLGARHNRAWSFESGGHGNINDEAFDEAEDDGEWYSFHDLMRNKRADLIVFGWVQMVRGGVLLLFAISLLLILFYISDSLYKERADGSTFFYRTMPVSDTAVIGAKLVFGSAGILSLSLVLGVCSVLYMRMIFPGNLADMLAAANLSLSQVSIPDFVADWFAFHLLATLWVLPYAGWFLLVSAVTRSRPLLVGIFIPVLLGWLVYFVTGENLIGNLVLSNSIALGTAIGHEGFNMREIFLDPGQKVELFESFWPYIVSWRTVGSLAWAGVFAGGTWFAYRRNIGTS